MSNIKTAIKVILVLMYSIGAVLYANEASDSIVKNIFVCINVIIPSMFIFMVISSYILSSGLYRKLFSPLYYIFKRLLKIDESLFSVFFLSLIGGYPIGIKLLSELIAQNKNYYAIAEKSIGFLYCISPSFSITMFGIGLYGNIQAGLIIYISNVLSNLIIAILWSRLCNLKMDIKTDISISAKGIIDSIHSSSEALIKICAIIIFFNSFITIFECILNDIGFIMPQYIKSFLEISNVLNTDNASVSSLPFISALASFGGFCVLIQCLSFINNNFNLKYFFVSRLFSMLLSYIISSFITHFSKISIPAYSSFNEYTYYFSTNKSASVFLLIMLSFFIWKNEKNFKKG